MNYDIFLSAFLNYALSNAIKSNSEYMKTLVYNRTVPNIYNNWYFWTLQWHEFTMTLIVKKKREMEYNNCHYNSITIVIFFHIKSLLALLWCCGREQAFLKNSWLRFQMHHKQWVDRKPPAPTDSMIYLRLNDSFTKCSPERFKHSRIMLRKMQHLPPL